MPLCGSSFCGCAVVSVPADFAELDGAYPTIDVAGNGTGASPWNLTVDNEWAGSVADSITSLRDSGGTYTPTLTGMVIGTGGTPVNTATWKFIGGPDVGNVGILQIEWRAVFGTSGQTFPTAPTITIPAGFNIVNSADDVFPLGRAFLQDATAAASNRWAEACPASATTFRILLGGYSGATATLTTTTPFTWASNDIMSASLSLLAVRV